MLSLLGKIWCKKQVNYSDVATLMSRYGISELIATLVAHRIALPEVADFLVPKISRQMPNPFLLKDMHSAVQRIVKAFEKSESVCIFADYDVDGATSAALLVHLFSHIGIKHFVYVPDRIKEGYGLSIFALEKIVKQASCMVSVDCGSSSYAEIEFAKGKGLDVIVIDHHISEKVPQDAIAVVNPNRLDESSNLGYLAAVGVTYLFLVAIVKVLKDKRSSAIASFELLSLLDLVALGTVCDVVPLIGLNRAFVSQGLKVIRMRQNLGIRTLIDCADLQEYIRAYHLGFVLGPRINAGGRVGKSNLGVKLLTEVCEEKAKKIALILNDHNLERKAIEMQMLAEAQTMAACQAEKGIIIVESDGWHPGVMGIIASRLVDLYNAPVAIVAWQGRLGKGSCRSIPGFDFGAAIVSAKASDFLVSGGGHKMAAGFTVEREQFENFKNFLYKKVDRKAFDQNLVHYFDATLTLASVNLDLLEQLQVLEPFGSGNSTPCFEIQKVYVVYSKVVGSDHVYCIFESFESQVRLSGTAFGAMRNKMGPVLLAKNRAEISIIVTLQKHLWSGNETARCIIKDVIECC